MPLSVSIHNPETLSIANISSLPQGHFYPSEGTGIGSGTVARVAFLPGVDRAFLPLGVDGAVATAVNVESLATSCARKRIFGTCSPVMSDLV